MKFIHNISECAIAEKSFLADGERILPYHELPQIFKTLGTWLDQKGVRTIDGIVLEIENSVLSALLVLFFLEMGYGFLVVQKQIDNGVALNNDVRYPSFIKYIVTSVNGVNGGAEDLYNPSRFLSITSNRRWREPGREISLTEKLFLKTSGSTGISKMVRLSHAGILGNAMNTAERIGLTSSDRIVLPVPLFHSYGLTTAFLSSIVVGASIDLQKGANLLRYLKREKEFQPNVAFLTPVFMEGLVKGGRGAPHPYRLTISAGDGFRQDMFSLYETQTGPIVNLYGSTEMGAIAAGDPEENMLIRNRYVGKPMPGVEICVRPCKEAVFSEMCDAGEFWCRHPFRFDCYVDLDGCALERGPEDPEGWFNLKDLGRLSPEGYVQVLGRSDHSVNRNGSLVFFADVERAMQTLPGLENVVMIAKGESSRGRTLIACCVPAKGATPSEHTIRQACFSCLPRNAVPDSIRIIERLPLLPNGKIDRRTLASSIESDGS